MLKIIRRRFLLMLCLLPGLNAMAFLYGVYHPRLSRFGESQSLALQTEPPRYLDYLRDLLGGSLGKAGGVLVSDLLWKSLLNSAILVVFALGLIVVLGPMLGFFSISRRTRRITPLGMIMTTLGASMPGFFLGVAVIALMIYRTLLTGSGMPLPMSGFGLDEHLILPVLVLSIRPVLQVAQITAGLVENELQQDYIRVAQSKGLAWMGIFWRHAIPNIGSAIANTLGQSARLLLPGLVIVETLFLWPGLGRMLMLTIGIRTDGRAQGQYFGDPELLAAIAVVFALWLLITDLIINLLSYRIDPRLQESKF